MSDSRKRIMEKGARRARAHRRLRQRIAGTAERPRLAVFKSTRFVYAQVIDDQRGATLAAAASLEPELRSTGAVSGANREAAKRVGEAIAERALAKGVKRVVFDRGGYRYHGKIRELAEAARAKGLEF